MTSHAAAFLALIPARLSSTRLPGKPLADIGGLPMVVRVARRAMASGAQRSIVCTDSPEVAAACQRHEVESVLTSANHPTGTDRLAEACRLLAVDPDTIVVNVQGDEPLIPPGVIAEVAQQLAANPDCAIATASHAIDDAAEFFDPNVVKVVTDARQRALYFSRSPLPWARDAFAAAANSPGGIRLAVRSAAAAGSQPELHGVPFPQRHIGLYAYRASFLAQFPGLAVCHLEQAESLEQLRALYHGFAISVLELDAPLPPGVDTPEDLEKLRRLIAGA